MAEIVSSSAEYQALIAEHTAAWQRLRTVKHREALLPTPHRRPTDAEALGNPLRWSPIGRSQHDARPFHIAHSETVNLLNASVH